MPFERAGAMMRHPQTDPAPPALSCARRSRATLYALATLLVVASSASAASPAATGEVRFATAKRVYLDKGEADGMRAGDKIAFSRNGRPAGSCTIDLLSAHDATCTARGPRIGDLFGLPRRAPPRPAPPAALPGPEPAETVARRALAVAAAPQSKVEFVPQPRAAITPTATVAGGFAVWGTTPGNPQYVAESLDVAIAGVPIGSSSLRFSTAFSIIRMQTAVLPRFRPGTTTEFYLWNAEVTRRELDAQTVLAVGRIWPWHTPGLPMLDGVQLGRRSESGAIEGGAYAGFIPETLTLAPTFDAWTTGAYGALSQTGARGDLLRVAEEEARVAIRHSPTVGWVREAEAQASVELGTFGVGGGARLRDAPEVDPHAGLERVDLEAWLRPAAGISARAQARYLGVPPEQEPLLRDELPRVLGGYHAFASLFCDPGGALGFALNAEAHHEADGDLNEVEAGADLHLATLFGGTGGLWLGATVGEGWLETRSAYVQAMVAASRLRLVGRFGGDVSRFAVPTGEAALSELGGSLVIDGRLSRRLRLVARGLLRVPTGIAGVVPDATLGFVSTADLVLSY
jgi:hypothetical protein